MQFWPFRRTWRAALLSCVAALVALLLGGAIVEGCASARAARDYPPPGTLVDIGGRRLHLLCIGSGEPTVVFIHSAFGNSLSSQRAREAIAQRTRVCSYDRGGVGWSDPAPSVVSAGDLVRELAVLQDRASLKAPHILVAASIGGLTAELFARQYPERLAGLVFLDAATSHSLSLPDDNWKWLRPAACTAGFTARFGVIRVIDPLNVDADDSADGRRFAALVYRPQVWAQFCSMAKGLPRTLEEFRTAPALRPDLPLTVLTASSTEGLVPPAFTRFVNLDRHKARVANHERLARQSTRGKWTIVPGSGHLIAATHPEAVADAVLQMLAK
jgi:pimeloyl-ACP methyl ester carboxylesterase